MQYRLGINGRLKGGKVVPSRDLLLPKVVRCKDPRWKLASILCSWSFLFFQLTLAYSWLPLIVSYRTGTTSLSLSDQSSPTLQPGIQTSLLRAQLHVTGFPALPWHPTRYDFLSCPLPSPGITTLCFSLCCSQLNSANPVPSIVWNAAPRFLDQMPLLSMKPHSTLSLLLFLYSYYLQENLPLLDSESLGIKIPGFKFLHPQHFLSVCTVLALFWVGRQRE